MKKQINLNNLKVGDKIEFLNRANYMIQKVVTKVSEKSCYLDDSRNSWNTVNSYFNEFNVKVN